LQVLPFVVAKAVKLCCFYTCRQRFACRTRCGLATAIFPLAQNENSKKERTTYRKPAMSFASC